jgi:hypothetical protein
LVPPITKFFAPLASIKLLSERVGLTLLFHTQKRLALHGGTPTFATAGTEAPDFSHPGVCYVINVNERNIPGPAPVFRKLIAALPSPLITLSNNLVSAAITSINTIMRPRLST